MGTAVGNQISCILAMNFKLLTYQRLDVEVE